MPLHQYDAPTLMTSNTFLAVPDRGRITTLGISCERPPFQLLDARTEVDVSLHFNELFPKRSSASFAC